MRGRDDLRPLFEEGQDGDLYGRQLSMEAQDNALLAPYLLFAVGVDEEREQAAIGPGRRLDDVGDDMGLPLLVEVR